MTTTKPKKNANGDLEKADEKPNVLQMALINKGQGGISLSHVAGSCFTSEVTRLKKLVFRATKGLAWVSVKDIAPLPHTH